MIILASTIHFALHAYTSTINFAFNFYSFFFLTHFEDEGKEWMVVVVCEEKETTKKIKKNLYFSKM